MRIHYNIVLISLLSLIIMTFSAFRTDGESDIPALIIDNYTINIQDSVICRSINQNLDKIQYNNDSINNPILLSEYIKHGTVIQKGDLFDINTLDSERYRISYLFKQNGFFTLDNGYIYFRADTIGKNNHVDLELVIEPYTVSQGDTITTTPHCQYYIGNIYIDCRPPIIEQDLTTPFVTDTIHKGGNYILYTHPQDCPDPYQIIENCHIQPGELYSDERTMETYKSLFYTNRLSLIDIKYEIDNNSNILKCNITARLRETINN